MVIKMENNDEIKKKNKTIKIMGIGYIVLIAAILIFIMYKPTSITPSVTSTSNQTMSAQIYKYVNVSDLRVNNTYYYPDNCSNSRTDYTQNNATTPAYISSVILTNKTSSEAFISVPYLINGSNYEYHYIVECR